MLVPVPTYSNVCPLADIKDICKKLTDPGVGVNSNVSLKVITLVPAANGVVMGMLGVEENLHGGHYLQG